MIEYIEMSKYHCPISKERFLQAMREWGYSMAQMYLAFSLWVQDNAKHPIIFAMRDAHPAFIATEWLDKEKKMNLKNYKSAWLTTNVAKALPFDKMTRAYITQEGITNAFTLADSGILGTIPKKLKKLGLSNPIDSLFIVKNLSLKDARGFLNEELFNEKHIRNNDFGYKNFCYGMLEKFPQRYSKFCPKSDGYITTEGKISPLVQEATPLEKASHDQFIAGMTDGLGDCFDAQMQGDKKQWSNYLDNLAHLHHILNHFDMQMCFYNQLFKNKDEHDFSNIYLRSIDELTRVCGKKQADFTNECFPSTLNFISRKRDATEKIYRQV